MWCVSKAHGSALKHKYIFAYRVMRAVSIYLRATFASVEPDTTNLQNHGAQFQDASLNYMSALNENKKTLVDLAYKQGGITSSGSDLA